MNILNNILKSMVCSSNLDDGRIKTNYDCEVCKKTGRPPNMLGRFIKINDFQKQCNGCKTIVDVCTTTR